jgi:hypothetical protein
MFLNPLLLAGLAGIGLPIAIHLLTRTPPRPVKWAAMRFLKQAVEKHKRRLRMEDLLLLILRCLIVALIALALARPMLRSAGWIGDAVGGQHRAYLLLDDSMSMSQTDGAATRFDLARGAAKKIVESLPVGSRVAVWRGSDAAIPVITDPTGDLAAVRASLDKLHVTDRASDLHAVLARFAELAPADRKSEVFVLTDAQRFAFRKLDGIVELLEANKQKLSATFVVVDRPEPANLAIAELRAADGVAVVDRPTRLVASVFNAGTTLATDVRVLLRAYAPGTALPGADDLGNVVDQQSIDRIAPGETKSVTLVARLRQPGAHVVEARLAEADRVPSDDRRSILLAATPKVRVLIVDGDLAGRGVEADSFFLQRVLVPMTGVDAQRHYVQTRVVSPTRFDLTSLDEIDVVVMVDVPDLSENAAVQLRTFVDRGGGLIVFTGERTRVPFYNDTLATRLDLLPATLAPATGDAADEAKALRFDTRSLDHPIAEIWSDPSAGPLDSVKIRRHTPLTNRAGARTVLKYADGSPAVVDAFKGRGYVCLVSTTADASWTDLPVRAGVFVPLVYRSIGQALLKQNEQPTGVAGARIDVPIADDVAPQTPLQIVGPKLSLAESQSDPDVVAETIAGRRVASWPRAEHAGAYDVALLSDEKQTSIARFTVQPDKSESDLAPMTDADRQRLVAVARVVKYDAGNAAFSATVRDDRAGLELSLPLLGALLLLVMFELLLAQRFGRSK